MTYLVGSIVGDNKSVIVAVGSHTYCKQMIVMTPDPGCLCT